MTLSVPFLTGITYWGTVVLGFLWGFYYLLSDGVRGLRELEPPVFRFTTGMIILMLWVGWLVPDLTILSAIP